MSAIGRSHRDGSQDASVAGKVPDLVLNWNEKSDRASAVPL
jgi:hypothetical protein